MEDPAERSWRNELRSGEDIDLDAAATLPLGDSAASATPPARPALLDTSAADTDPVREEGVTASRASSSEQDFWDAAYSASVPDGAVPEPDVREVAPLGDGRPRAASGFELPEPSPLDRAAPEMPDPLVTPPPAAPALDLGLRRLDDGPPEAADRLELQAPVTVTPPPDGGPMADDRAEAPMAQLTERPPSLASSGP